MKKILALWLAVSEAAVIEFEATRTNAVGYHAKKWCGSAADRAALAVLLMADFSAAFDRLFTFDYFHQVYIGRSGNRILMGFYNNTACLMVGYDPFSKEAACYLDERAMGSMIPKRFCEGYCSSHYVINAKDIIDRLAEITAALQ